jgi:N-acetyl-anhydromuramyl-L-alanine amidase AmpD
MLFQTVPLAIHDKPARADHYTKGREGPISCIVIHATAGTNSLDWLTWQSPVDKAVSVHRLISKDGRIFKIVSDVDTAWHAGPSQRWQGIGDQVFNMNAVSLGIELENRNTKDDLYPTAQLASCGRQIVEWWGKYGFLPVVYHYEVQANKEDPRFLQRSTLSYYIWLALRAVIQ